MHDRELLPALRVKFTDPADVATFGEGWFIYDERALVRKPARELIAIEEETGLAMPQAMNEMRRSSVLGDLFGAWVAVREHDPKLAGPFEDFSPLVMLLEWERVPEDAEAGKGESFLPILPPTPSVTLQTLPVTELPS